MSCPHISCLYNPTFSQPFFFSPFCRPDCGHISPPTPHTSSVIACPETTFGAAVAPLRPSPSLQGDSDARMQAAYTPDSTNSRQALDNSRQTLDKKPGLLSLRGRLIMSAADWLGVKKTTTASVMVSWTMTPQRHHTKATPQIFVFTRNNCYHSIGPIVSNPTPPVSSL